MNTLLIPYGENSVVFLLAYREDSLTHIASSISEIIDGTFATTSPYERLVSANFMSFCPTSIM